jgi:hypothetical protein
MKVGCVFITLVGVGFFVSLLVEMVPALFDVVDFLDQIEKWSWNAERPLFILLLGVIGCSLCCLAERFVPRGASPLEQDYGDKPRSGRVDMFARRPHPLSMFVLRIMKHGSAYIAILGVLALAMAVTALFQPRFVNIRWTKREREWLQLLTPSLIVMVLSAIAYSTCCLAQWSTVRRRVSVERRDQEDQGQ